MIVYPGCVVDVYMVVGMRYGLLSGWYGEFLIGVSMLFVVFEGGILLEPWLGWEVVVLVLSCKFFQYTC